MIGALDPAGFSPAVMQSNHDFGVAATLSVNAHGWPVPFGPFGSTVRAFRLMLPSGELVTCSPTENAELFGLVTGGYGLFGVVVDLDVAMVGNVLLRPTYELMPAARLGPRMVEVIGAGRRGADGLRAAGRGRQAVLARGAAGHAAAGGGLAGGGDVGRADGDAVA